jgi:hypothetical protein
MNIYVVKVVLHPKKERVDCQIRISIYLSLGWWREWKAALHWKLHNDAFVILGSIEAICFFLMSFWNRILFVLNVIGNINFMVII